MAFSSSAASGSARSRRPRPLSSSSILDLLGVSLYLWLGLSFLPDGSRLGGGGGGGGAGGAVEEEDADGKELVIPVKGVGEVVSMLTCAISDGAGSLRHWDDDPQYTSSFNSSSSMGLISGMRNEDSHFQGNYETRDLRNRLPWVAPVLPVNLQANNSVVNRKKGLLSSFYTIAKKLLVFCGSLVILSLSYPLAANAKETFEDRGMQGIIIGSIISFFISCLLTALASYLKDSESIKGVGFHVFKWLVLLVFLFLSAGLCVILRFCAHTPKSVLWTLGTIGYITIVSIWVWVFYVEVPQIHEEMKKVYETEIMMPSQGSDSVPASATPGLP